MKPVINVDFHDEIYKRTGIKSHSLSHKEIEFTSDGRGYIIQLIKKNDGSSETIYITLKDILGRQIEDLKIQIGKKIYKFNKKLSQDSIVIEDVERDLENMELKSEREGVEAILNIHLERPEELDIKESIRVNLASQNIYKRLRSFLTQIGKSEDQTVKGNECIKDIELIKIADPRKDENIAEKYLKHLLIPCFYCTQKFVSIFEKFSAKLVESTVAKEGKKGKKEKKKGK